IQPVLSCFQLADHRCLQSGQMYDPLRPSNLVPKLNQVQRGSVGIRGHVKCDLLFFEILAARTSFRSPIMSKSDEKRSEVKKSGNRKSGRKWVQGVKTVSTFPSEKLFTKDAETIAESLASRKGLRAARLAHGKAFTGAGLPGGMSGPCDIADRAEALCG